MVPQKRFNLHYSLVMKPAIQCPVWSCLPQNAGTVRLVLDPKVSLPRREANKGVPILRLPFRKGTTVTALKAGEFVVHYPERSIPLFAWLGGRPLNLARLGESRHPSFTLLAGYDGAPFIRGVPEEVYQAFVRFGEEAFHRALVPSHVSRLKDALGTLPTVRQGSVWAVRIPLGLHELSECTTDPSGRRRIGRLADYLSGRAGGLVEPILGTSHNLCGKSARVDLKVGGSVIEGARIGSGVLSSPDYGLLDVREGLYLFARTPYVDPS